MLGKILIILLVYIYNPITSIIILAHNVTFFHKNNYPITSWISCYTSTYGYGALVFFSTYDANGYAAAYYKCAYNERPVDQKYKEGDIADDPFRQSYLTTTDVFYTGGYDDFTINKYMECPENMALSGIRFLAVNSERKCFQFRCVPVKSEAEDADKIQTRNIERREPRNVDEWRWIYDLESGISQRWVFRAIQFNFYLKQKLVSGKYQRFTNFYYVYKRLKLANIKTIKKNYLDQQDSLVKKFEGEI